jgi:uncharacterized protein YggE
MKRILIALLFCGSVAFAQDPTGVKPFIEVTGTSETEIVPDEIYITITLQERNEGKDKLTIEKQEDDLKKNLKELGIDLNNLSLNAADVDFRKIRAFKKDVMIAKSYVLKVQDASMVGKVYERLDRINAQDAYISRFTHSKILDFQKENRIKAIKAAKDKAEYLLAAVGKQAGNPLQVMETDNYVQDGPQPPMYRARNSVQSMDFSGGDDGHDISFKKIRVRSGFMVKYEIK